jgi:hypothetical protein
MDYISSWSMLVLLLGKNMNTMKRNKEALLEASREVCLEESTEKTKYMVVSHHQNAGQNHNLLIATTFFEKWQSSNIWKQQHQIRIVFMKKSRTD